MEANTNKTVVNEVMDARIVKLNEIIGVRLASINSKKRPAVKEAKELAKYILANWDDEFELLKIKSEDVKNDTVREVLSSRLQNFVDAKNACKKAVEESEESNNKVELTEKERTALILFVKASEWEEGFIMDDVEKLAKENAGIDVKSLKGLCSSLQKKGVLEMYNGYSYYDGAVTELGMVLYSNLPCKAISKLNGESKAEEPKKEEKKEEPKKEVKKETKKTEATKTSGRKVGDVHPNGKWVWTEYQPGKFDWRTIPSMKQKTGAKPKEGVKKDKESNKVAKSVAKQSKKAESKKALNKATEAPKMLTIDEFRTMPKQARNGKKMSKAQEDALKLIMKGYWIEVNHGPAGAEYAFFVNSEGDRKQCYMDSVKTLFKRYGIDYIPEGLVK